MARFVDGDKLSEQITTEYCGKCGIYNGELCCSCPMNDALNYIEEAPTAEVAPRAEWISVEERLPEKQGRYLVYGVIGGLDFVGGMHYDRHNGFDPDITHWMPLPEPPKGEKHDPT